jgi:hypothetical protein
MNGVKLHSESAIKSVGIGQWCFFVGVAMHKIRFLVLSLSISLALSLTFLVLASAQYSQPERSQVFNLDIIAHPLTSIASTLSLLSSQYADTIKSDVRLWLERKKVAPHSRPETWSIALLGLGLLLYQVRRRRHVGMAWDLR